MLIGYPQLLVTFTSGSNVCQNRQDKKKWNVAAFKSLLVIPLTSKNNDSLNYGGNKYEGIYELRP